MHDHPALATAAANGQIIPLFIFDDVQLKSRHAGANRTRFLLQSLKDLRDSLQKLGGDLVLRSGRPEDVLTQLAAEFKAEAVLCTADYTPYARQRDARVATALAAHNIAFTALPGRLIVDSLDGITTKTGKAYSVFTPFFKYWQTLNRRDLAEVPTRITLPDGVNTGNLPNVSDIANTNGLSPNALPGGETAGRERLQLFLSNGIEQYANDDNDLGSDGTSRISAYLHFGCLSPREIEEMLPPGDGPMRWHRQLAWREFYNYIIYKFPENGRHEFQERFRTLEWSYDESLLQAWADGLTGYPIVDAAMRQLKQEGWMHNRGRLIVGSFLTKDLALDWRLGEQHFMRMLIDGDQANNNGNWQWIASVGVDPAPVFRRLYNPASQQGRHDPSGIYVRRYIHELANVPNRFLAEPWKMNPAEQQTAGCIIGKDYPEPIVDHASARVATLERFRRAAASAR